MHCANPGDNKCTRKAVPEPYMYIYVSLNFFLGCLFARLAAYVSCDTWPEGARGSQPSFFSLFFCSGRLIRSVAKRKDPQITPRPIIDLLARRSAFRRPLERAAAVFLFLFFAFPSAFCLSYLRVGCHAFHAVTECRFHRVRFVFLVLRFSPGNCRGSRTFVV